MLLAPLYLPPTIADLAFVSIAKEMNLQLQCIPSLKIKVEMQHLYIRLRAENLLEADSQASD